MVMMTMMMMTMMMAMSDDDDNELYHVVCTMHQACSNMTAITHFCRFS